MLNEETCLLFPVNVTKRSTSYDVINLKWMLVDESCDAYVKTNNFIVILLISFLFRYDWFIIESIEKQKKF